MATSQQLLQQRNAIRDQMNLANTPVTQDDAFKYISEKVGNFEPLNQERRAIQSQAAQVLPSQIQQYVQARDSGTSNTASPLTMLNSIMRNRSNLMATSDLIGDQIEQGRGRLSQIANSGLQQLGQRQQSLKDQFNIFDQDYQRALAQEEAARQRAAAQRAAAMQAAAMRAAQQRATQGGITAMIGNEQEKGQSKGNERWNKTLDTFQRFDPFAAAGRAGEDFAKQDNWFNRAVKDRVQTAKDLYTNPMSVLGDTNRWFYNPFNR